MMLLVSLLIGIAIGVVTGLVPGLHPNTTIPIVMHAGSFLSPLEAAVMLVSIGIVNSFVGFIPSILVGAPEGGSELCVLPGHALMMQGRGYEAIMLTAYGGLGAAVVSLLLLPVFWVILKGLYYAIRPNLHYVLLFVVFYMVVREIGAKKKILSLAVFLMSGLLGLAVLNSTGVPSPLLPLLTGLFGLPMLIISMTKHAELPKQDAFAMKRLKKRTVLSAISIGSVAGIIAGLLPGIGSSQAAVLSQEATGHRKKRSFLISVGGVNTSDVIYSILALYLIGNPRSGIAVAVGELINVTFQEVLLFLGICLVTSVVAFCATKGLARRLISLMGNVDYSMLSYLVFSFLVLLISVLSGFRGIIIAVLAMLIGLLANCANVKRSHCMGCLLLPTIMFFSGIRL